MPRQSTLLCLQQLSQVSNTSRLNSNQLKNALNRLEALFRLRRQVLVRASLMDILQQLKTVLQMELLVQQQQEQLLVQLQRHLADYGLINPDHPALFGLGGTPEAPIRIEELDPHPAEEGRHWNLTDQ